MTRLEDVQEAHSIITRWLIKQRDAGTVVGLVPDAAYNEARDSIVDALDRLRASAKRGKGGKP